MCYCLVPFPYQNAKILAIVYHAELAANFVYTYLILSKLISIVEMITLYGQCFEELFEVIPTSTFAVYIPV